MLNNYFDKIYLLNLDRRTDRMIKCSDAIESNNIIYERFSAIDGVSLNLNDYGITDSSHNKNDLGCLLSHLSILKDIKKNSYDNVLILEDDFELCMDFNKLLPIYMDQLPSDWQWLYFGGSNFEDPDKVTENIYKVKRTLTTHAYAVRKEIVYDLINILESNLTSSVDSALSIIQKKFKTYITIPHLIYQQVGYSDIQHKEVDYLGIRYSKLNVNKS